MPHQEIEFFTPEERARVRQQFATGGARAAGPTVTATDPFVQRAIEQGRARATAAKAALGQAATSIPAGENLAPVSTAEAATRPTFGQRLIAARDIGRRAAPLVGRGIGAAQVAGAGLDITEQGATLENVANLAAGAGTLASPAAGLALGGGIAAGRALTPDVLAVRLAQAASRTLGKVPGLERFFGGYDTGVADFEAGRAQPAVPAPVPALAARVPSPAGAGTEIVPLAQPAAVEQAPVPPVRFVGTGRRGLADFVAGIGNVAVGAAAANRAARLAGEEQERQAASIKAVGELTKTLSEARSKDLTVVQDLAGNPVIIDKSAATARTPEKIPSFEEYAIRVREQPGQEGLSEKFLREKYNQRFGR